LGNLRFVTGNGEMGKGGNGEKGGMGKIIQIPLLLPPPPYFPTPLPLLPSAFCLS